MIGSKKTLLGSWPQNRGELHYIHQIGDMGSVICGTQHSVPIVFKDLCEQEELSSHMLS